MCLGRINRFQRPLRLTRMTWVRTPSGSSYCRANKSDRDGCGARFGARECSNLEFLPKIVSFSTLFGERREYSLSTWNFSRGWRLGLGFCPLALAFAAFDLCVRQAPRQFLLRPITVHQACAKPN